MLGGRCKWLWFSGMHEGKLASRKCVRCVPPVNEYGGYQSNYAGALISARDNAPVLQPVLMLGRHGLNATSGLSHFGRWARTQGALVFNVDRLEFQDQLDRYLGPRLPGAFRFDHMQGPYLRLHVPVLIRKHHLLTKDICSDVVLYTDCDVVFLHVSAHAMMVEQSLLHGHVWSFSSEGKNSWALENTGVMLINNTAFEGIYTDFIEFGIKHKFDFEAFDQGWIRRYSSFTKHRGTARFLHTEWNWKVYWGNKSKKGVKIVHFHGPKPGIGTWLSCLASQDPTCLNTLDPKRPYTHLVKMGFKADYGHLANVTLRMYMDMIDSADPPVPL